MENIFITKIEIKQLRHLKDVVIELDANERKHLVITGKNGSGKTSLLEAIWAYKKIRKADSVQPSVLGTTISVEYNNESSSKETLVTSKFGAKRNTKMLIPKGISKIEEDPKRPLSYYFIQFLVNQKAIKSFSKDEGNYQESQRIEAWFQDFEDNLKYLFGDDKFKLIFDSRAFNFHFQFSNGNIVDANNLPDGIASLLNIVAQVILSIPEHSDLGAQGVVLIDEIEAHLHIDLQKKVLPFLADFFPNIQFIVTTHSPFVISSEADCVVFDLENKIRIEDATGYSFDTIIESYFGSDKYSHEVTKKVQQYESLALKSELTPKEKIKHLKLKKYFDHVPLELAPELEVKLQQIKLAQLNKKAG